MADKKIKRIFVNNVNGFESKHIARYLSQCVVGASQEEGDEEAEEVEEGEDRKKDGTYEIYATLNDREAKRPDFVKELFNFPTREELYDHVVECDVIVYDINDDPSQIDEAVWLVSALHADADKLMRKKIFILISSTMTWAKTRPLDPEDPEIPFTEEDFRRRKPFPSYKEHLSAEKAVLKGGKATKGKLSTYVVAAGLTFGEEENIFHYLFKSAWHNQPFLPVHAPGDNFLPTIHIRDLAAVVQNIADSPPKTYYIVAVCDAKNTLEEITRAVSRKLTTGKVKLITREEAFLIKDLTQNDLDLLTTSLRIDASYIKDSMHIEWVAETGIPDAINNVANEYRQARKLQPLRLCILGPPASGKTTLAHQLAERYKIHHIKIQDVIDGAINELERLVAQSTAVPNPEEQVEELGEEEERRMAESGELLEQVIENQKENNGRLDDRYVLRFFKEKLLSKPCQNQGFVLDGFPKTMDHALALFQLDENDEEEEEGAGERPAYNTKIMPEFIFGLHASDEFLRRRIITLPDSIVQGTHNTEEQFQRRITDYRTLNTDDETVLNYFDELEIHPIPIDVTKDLSAMSKETVERLVKLIGPARNYGPTAEELEQMRVVEEERKTKQADEVRLLRERQEVNEQARKRHNLAEWRKRLETVQREEQEMMDMANLPLRNYLMRNVMPSLTKGLMDCVKTRPDDPIDFIAEFLLRDNQS